MPWGSPGRWWSATVSAVKLAWEELAALRLGRPLVSPLSIADIRWWLTSTAWFAMETVRRWRLLPPCWSVFLTLGQMIGRQARGSVHADYRMVDLLG